MKCIIEINMDNAAFESDNELSNILREFADRLDKGFYVPDAMSERDSNGNTVAYLTIDE